MCGDDPVALSVVLEDFDLEKAGGFHQGGDGGALGVADFQEEMASGLEVFSSVRDEAADQNEAVIAGEEGQARLEVENFVGKIRAFPFPDVGGVADDDLEIVPLRAESLEEVGEEEVDPAVEVVSGGVGGGDLKGIGADVGGRDLKVGPLGGQCEGNGPGAGANVETSARGVCVEAGEGGADEGFGIRSGDQHPGVDGEVEGPELPKAEDVGDRFAGGAALHQSAVVSEFVADEGAIEVGVELDALEGEDVGEEIFGVQARGLASSLGEKVGGPVQEFQDRPGRTGGLRIAHRFRISYGRREVDRSKN